MTYEERITEATSEMTEEEKNHFMYMLSLSDKEWLENNYMHPFEYKRLAQYGLKIKAMFGSES